MVPNIQDFRFFHRFRLLAVCGAFFVCVSRKDNLDYEIGLWTPRKSKDNKPSEYWATLTACFVTQTDRRMSKYILMIYRFKCQMEAENIWTVKQWGTKRIEKGNKTNIETQTQPQRPIDNLYIRIKAKAEAKCNKRGWSLQKERRAWHSKRTARAVTVN